MVDCLGLALAVATWVAGRVDAHKRRQRLGIPDGLTSRGALPIRCHEDAGVTGPFAPLVAWLPQ